MTGLLVNWFAHQQIDNAEIGRVSLTVYDRNIETKSGAGTDSLVFHGNLADERRLPDFFTARNFVRDAADDLHFQIPLGILHGRIDGKLFGNIIWHGIVRNYGPCCIDDFQFFAATIPNSRPPPLSDREYFIANFGNGGSTPDILNGVAQGDFGNIPMELKRLNKKWFLNGNPGPLGKALYASLALHLQPNCSTYGGVDGSGNERSPRRVLYRILGALLLICFEASISYYIFRIIDRDVPTYILLPTFVVCFVAVAYGSFMPLMLLRARP